MSRLLNNAEYHHDITELKFLIRLRWVKIKMTPEGKYGGFVKDQPIYPGYNNPD